MIAKKPQEFVFWTGPRLKDGPMTEEELHDLVARIDDIVERVRVFRLEMAAVWPTPTWDDSLWFAHSESGEVSDAVMRLKPEYVRNNHRTPSVQAEMADQAIMLASAIAKEGMSATEAFSIPDKGEWDLDRFYDADRADIYTAEAKFWAVKGDVQGALDCAVDALICMLRSPQFVPAETHIALKMDTLRRKHLLKEE